MANGSSTVPDGLVVRRQQGDLEGTTEDGTRVWRGIPYDLPPVDGLRGRPSYVADNRREAIDTADAIRDYVEGAAESYLLRRDERSEVGIRRLTVLAGVLCPLSLLTGIYGVNFARIPGTGAPYGFWVFVVAQLALSVAALWYLRRRGLL